MSPRDSASLLLNVCRCGLAKCNLAGYTRLRALNLYGCRPAQHQNQHFPHCSVWIKKNVRTLASISINICRHQPQDNLVANVSSEGKASLRFPGRTRIGRSQKIELYFLRGKDFLYVVYKFWYISSPHLAKHWPNSRFCRTVLSRTWTHDCKIFTDSRSQLERRSHPFWVCWWQSISHLSS